MTRSENSIAGVCGYTRSAGSILIYVLWILVLISGLAFQVTANSRVKTLHQSAAASQLKTRLQIESAIQYAEFKILAKQWRDRRFELFLNKQNLRIEVFNESGFISLYEPNNPDLRNVFETVGLGSNTIQALAKAVESEKGQVRFNCFDELLGVEGIDAAKLAQLAPLVSIFHEDPVNPSQAPNDVLAVIDGIDRRRVQLMAEAVDPAARRQLRDELVGIVSRGEGEFSRDTGPYYRIRLSLGSDRYRIIVKDNRQHRFKTLLVERDRRSTGNS